MNAIRLPIGIWPLPIRWPPNQTTVMVDRFMMTSREGNAAAKIRLTSKAVEVRSALAAWKRSRS